MIDSQGWFDWMIRDPGPINPDKVNGGINTVRGMIPHSAEGYWSHLQTLLHTGPDSWGASNLKDGRCYQHYSIYQQTQTSGAGYPNNNFWTNETEGRAGEALTGPQVDNIVRQIKELSALKGWKPRRPINSLDVTATLYEHKECVRWGAKYTACPSGRIPWGTILSMLEEEDVSALVWNPEFSRLYLVGSLPPQWITSPAQAAALEKVFGKPKVALSWAELKALGA